MAINGYDKKVNKHQDWGGDNSTGGLPVLGSRVQEFIKEQFENRIGVLYYDSANNRYIAFADEENRDAYIETGDPSLVLGTFDAPFNYSAEITLTTPTYNAVFFGSIGNYIDFTFDIKNKAGASTGENVYVTYTIMHNATKRVVTETRRYGESVHFNVDQYLKEGVNTIIVGISGQNTLAATTTAITYQVVDLQIKDELDISKVYNLASGSTEMEIIWSVKGYGTKVVEWYIDGVLQPFDRVVDEVVAIEGGSPKYITLSALGNGRHSLQMRAYTTINGENFYTDTLYRDFIVYDGATTTPTIGVALTIPKDFGVVASGSSLVIYDIIQYVPYTFKFATFSPLGEASMNVDVFIGDEKKGSVASKNGVVNEFLFVSNKTGATTLRLVADKATLSIPANVAVTNMSLREITEGLMFDFNANGRNNNASDKDQWSYGEYTATFEGFNWNTTSGWVNNRLRISDGATFGVNFAPLNGSPVALGRTIEIEFSTTNVTNDDVVICDLRQNGVGILITATKVLLHSEEGAEIVNEFKENENVRFAFVMNRVSGVTNKGLAFIYTNGIVARCINYSITDDFASSANIQFSGSSQAQVLLKAIRVYNQALSSDDILNNFTLYRDNVADMMDVYDRNNVYEEGTVTFSPDKMVNRLPVMIVTGDIPTLENTNDKDTQIIVDIEYTNMQDPSKNFTMTQAAMRPQGTSSMGYPKKNFRIYTQKVDGTILKDSQGNVVANKLYAFTEGAQPVDCWCLKADYAESSGTHNTGIARMWHDILMNTQLDGEYVLRTNAQKAAILSNYQYDVRTTIDGFPILLFYRRTATSDLIFIGKYNFNNDKSTESVFGFEGIPNFNNSRMQCWEILNNGNAIALFTNISDFYKTITVGNETQEGWKFAFESRYPDTKTPITTDLYNFATWMNGVSQSAFATEKWAHMDVYKMAAYYCYLMRFAGADQFVKNAMLTSEDGEHFYFILYDNDTINGLINTGRLAISPSDNRQTKDASGEYVFAGHDSVLWNRLEADSEFMAIVSAIDDAMFSAGLSYENAIHFFDELQAEKWVERVYNQDAQYKYITPYVESGTNNLFMLQGDRAIHRKWFLAKRFALYDSLLVSGAYKSQSMEFKCINNTQAGQTFTVTSGNNMNYGYGINDVPREVGVSLDVNESYDFVTKETVNLGDPIRLYAAPNIKGLDFSKMTARLATMDITKVYTESLGTQLTSLIIGNASATNNELTTISGLNKANKLEVLDVQGCKGLTSLDLSNQPYFKTLKAKGSSVASVIFANGAAVERIELPSLVKTLTLSQLPYLDGANVEIDGGWGNITSINVTECPNVTNDFSLVWNWFNSITPSECSLVMDNVVWEGVTKEQLVALKSLKVFNVRGYAKLNSITLEDIEYLQKEFGENIFDSKSSFFITSSPAIFIQGNAIVADGETAQYSAVVFEEFGTSGTVTYSISSGANSYVFIDSATGFLTTTERGSEYSITVRATYSNGTTVIMDEMSVTIKKAVYPQNATIAGNAAVEDELEEYTWTTTTENVNGNFYSEWSLSGDAVNDGYLYLKSQTNDKAVVQLLSMPEFISTATLTLTLKKSSNNQTLLTQTKELTVKNANVIMTKDTNPAVMAIMFAKGLAANENYMTKAEAQAVTDGTFNPSGTQSGSIFYNNTNITSFDELKHFTGMTTLDAYAFYGCINLASLKVPSTIVNFGAYCCYRDSNFVNLTIDEITVETVASYAFYSYSNTASQITINKVNWRCTETCSSSRTNLFRYTIINQLNVYDLSAGYTSSSSTYHHFYYAYLNNIIIDESITDIPQYAFCYAYNINGLSLTNNITSIGTYAFYPYQTGMFNVNRMSNSITTLGSNAFRYPIFKTDIDFSNLTFSSSTCISNATYQGKVDLKNNENGGSTLYLAQLFSNFNSCESLVLPNRTLTFNYTSASGKVNNFYIPDMAKYCISTFSGSGSPAAYANSLYIGNSSGTYNKVSALNLNSYGITQLSSYAFYGCKAITALDATSLTTHNQYIFCNSGITNLILDNHGASSSIAAYAYRNCTSLATITDRSTTPWTTLNNQAFAGVNSSVEISSLVFGLYKQSSGLDINPMGNNVIYSYSFGNLKFTAPSGAYFANEETTKTLTLSGTGTIEDLTDRLRLEYLTLTIKSNMADSMYRLEYTASDGTEKIEEVGVGTQRVKATINTDVTITPLSTYSGYDAPEETTVTMNSATKTTTMEYTEATLIYIKHINGLLYTTDEWTSNGFSNDLADGVCLMQSIKGGFVISKEYMVDNEGDKLFQFGGYNKTAIGVTTHTSKNVVISDFDGYGNTPKIIEQYAGYTNMNITGAPAAEAAANYTFPSGTKGYLPALGEWLLVANKIDEINAAMGIIGAEFISDYSWSSIIYNNTKAWRIDATTSEYNEWFKNYLSKVRPFSAYGKLIINSNLGVYFTLTYTNNYGDLVNTEVAKGECNLNIKTGTTITITPHTIGNGTAEPQSFTWTNAVHEASFTFAKDAGVYIQHINKSLYTTDEWTSNSFSNDLANGVAVLSSNVGFVISKSSVNNLTWGDSVLVEGVKNTSTKSEALLDYYGYSNTQKIIAKLGVGNARAAEKCADYTFPNGNKGYLPALGEWQCCFDNITAINAAMSLIGGEGLYSVKHWSSTQSGESFIWYMNPYNGDANYESRGYSNRVKVFTLL